MSGEHASGKGLGKVDWLTLASTPSQIHAFVLWITANCTTSR
jgi:hypothetical protein